MLSEAKHPASTANEARSFAKTLRMTAEERETLLLKTARAELSRAIGFTDDHRKEPGLGGMAAVFGGHVFERQHGREDAAMPPGIRMFLRMSVATK